MPFSVVVSDPPGDAVAVSVAVRAPAAVGVKTTLTVHEEPAAIWPPQVPGENVKSPASGPLIATDAGPDAAWPVLVTV